LQTSVHPVVEAFLEEHPPRKVLLSGEHADLGSLVLVNSSWATFGEHSAVHEPAFEWIGLFEPVGGEAMPLVICVDDNWMEDVEWVGDIDPRDDPILAAAAKIEYPAEALSRCRNAWSEVIQTTVTAIAKDTADMNIALQRRGMESLPLACLDNISVDYLEISQNELFVQVRIPYGAARLSSIDGKRWIAASCDYDTNRIRPPNKE
jgi:hypothetical protein